MKERTIWLNPGQEVEYCPYCHSGNVWPREKAGLWTCQDCLYDFIVRYRKPAPKPKARAMSPEEFHALEQKAKEQEESQMTNDQARGVFGSAKRLGYSEDDARALLTKTFDAATTELNEHWIKNRLPWQAPMEFTAPASSAPSTLNLKPDLGPRSKNPNSRICEVWVKGKYRELTTKDEPPSKDSLWELNNLVDIQETGIIGSKPLEQWIYPDGRPDNWGFRPAS